LPSRTGQKVKDVNAIRLAALWKRLLRCILARAAPRAASY
jgi:hypothetical protein